MKKILVKGFATILFFGAAKFLAGKTLDDLKDLNEKNGNNGNDNDDCKS